MPLKVSAFFAISSIYWFTRLESLQLECLRLWHRTCVICHRTHVTRSATLGETVHFSQVPPAVAMVTGVGGTLVNWRGNSGQVVHLLLHSGKPHTGDIYFRSSVPGGLRLCRGRHALHLCLCVCTCTCACVCVGVCFAVKTSSRTRTSFLQRFTFSFSLFCGAKLPNSDHFHFIFASFGSLLLFFYLFHPHKRTHDHVQLAFTIVNIIKET